MKPVMHLVVSDDGSGFGWQFEPNLTEQRLPPFTFAAAALQLQAMAQSLLAAKTQPTTPNVQTAGVELLNRINGRKAP